MFQDLKILLKKKVNSLINSSNKFNINELLIITQDYEDEKIIKDKKKYYIDYVKSFPVNGKIYYEVAFRLANDYTSKFDRVIAFSKKEIKPNYAVELTFRKGSINLFGKKIPVDIIEDYRVSIRPCELNNFAKLLFGESK